MVALTSSGEGNRTVTAGGLNKMCCGVLISSKRRRIGSAFEYSC